MTSIITYAGSPLGNLGEVSLQTDDIDSSISYWKTLGFTLKLKEADPYPWAILVQGKAAIGLHETNEWSGQYLTFFHPKAIERIKELEKDGVKIDHYIKGADGKIIGVTFMSPEGQNILLVTGVAQDHGK